MGAIPASGRPTSLADVPGLMAALSKKASISEKTVADVDYQVLVSDTQVTFLTLTATRTAVLPSVASFPKGQDLLICDGSGQCSETIAINIAPNLSSGDTIAGLLDESGDPGFYQLTAPHQFLILRPGGPNVWIVR